MSPRLQLGVRQDRDVDRDRAPRDLAQEHAARGRRLRQFLQRLAVDVLAGHVDIDAFDRHRQQLAIVDFLRLLADQLHEHVAPARHGDDVAGMNDGIGGRIDDLAASVEAAG